MTTTTDAPSIYVGTYAKYNNGSIEGAWIELDGHDKETFYAACRALHKDEADPELMFQDYQNFPREYYGESCLSDGLWEWLELDDDEKELLSVYISHVEDRASYEQAREAFAGKYDSPEAWAEQLLDDTGSLASVPEELRHYIDFEAYARDAGYNGMIFIQHDGEVWVFNP